MDEFVDLGPKIIEYNNNNTGTLRGDLEIIIRELLLEENDEFTKIVNQFCDEVVFIK